jgi:hypothetical protein
MRSRRSRILLGTALALTLAIPTIGRADDKDKKVSQNWLVYFGQPQPQDTPAAVTHFLLPDDITIQKGDRVTFVVNGGGHGIAIHRVSKKTTREDIAEDLCQGGANDADRLGRSAVCNGTIVTGVDAIIGTQNLNYDITDGKGDLVIHTGINTATVPNPRVDDTENSERLLATSGRAPAADKSLPAANPAGAFLTGTAPTATPGNRIQVQFLKSGRYLVICMNRAHSLNDHMFGFVTVSDDDDDDK